MKDSSLPLDGMSPKQRYRAVAQVHDIEHRLFCINLAPEGEARRKHLHHLRRALEHVQLWLALTHLISVRETERHTRTAAANAASQANTEAKPNE